MARLRLNAAGALLAPTVAYGNDATCLSELMVGESDTVLWYPGVGSCATFTAVTPTRLVGCHISMDATKPMLKTLFAKMAEWAGKGAITALYLGGNSEEWKTFESPLGKKPADMMKFARAELGFKGNAYYYDSKDLVTKPLPHMCMRATFSGTAGAVIDVMAQTSGSTPSDTEKKAMKVVPPPKLQTLK